MHASFAAPSIACSRTRTTIDLPVRSMPGAREPGLTVTLTSVLATSDEFDGALLDAPYAAQSARCWAVKTTAKMTSTTPATR
jgi:hypothetical protein